MNFLNEAQTVDDLTNIEKHRPDLFEANWFSFERISEMIDPFINYFGMQKYTYIDLVLFRGFVNGGTVADCISPDDLVVIFNPAE